MEIILSTPILVCLVFLVNNISSRNKNSFHDISCILSRNQRTFQKWKHKGFWTFQQSSLRWKSPRISQGRGRRAFLAKNELAGTVDGLQQVGAPLVCPRLHHAWVPCAAETAKFTDPATDDGCFTHILLQIALKPCWMTVDWISGHLNVELKSEEWNLSAFEGYQRCM